MNIYVQQTALGLIKNNIIFFGHEHLVQMTYICISVVD